MADIWEEHQQKFDTIYNSLTELIKYNNNIDYLIELFVAVIEINKINNRDSNGIKPRCTLEYLCDKFINKVGEYHDDDVYIKILSITKKLLINKFIENDY